MNKGWKCQFSILYTHTFLFLCTIYAKIMRSIFSKIRIHELIKTIYTLSVSCLQCKHTQIKPLSLSWCRWLDVNSLTGEYDRIDGWMYYWSRPECRTINGLFHLFLIRESLKITKLIIRWTTNTTNICFLASARKENLNYQKNSSIERVCRVETCYASHLFWFVLPWQHLI